MLSTHRTIQLAELHYTAEVGVIIALRCAKKLSALGNISGARHFIQRANKFDSIRNRCAARLGGTP